MGCMRCRSGRRYRPGARPSKWLRRRTFDISIVRSSASCRSYRRAMPTCGPAPRASTRSEPIVADGGEVVLYAPHIPDVAKMHPGLLQVGYHCRDFFLAHWERFRDLPRGELAHATHLYGAGTYDPMVGETERVRVTLATGIPEEVVSSINLHYRDPATIDVREWEADPEALVVPDAGEVLYRLR